MHANLLYKVIQEQAGSFAKAAMEAVQNAIDAGGTKVVVDLNGKDFLIEDDGAGFASKKVIEDFFETWGTPHTESDENRPRYGQHRLGRGQLFAYGRNVWESNGFRMEVDFKNNRDGYVLSSGHAPIKGCRITGELYEALLPSDRYDLEKTLKDLVYYSEIPVIFNGTNIAHAPADEKWTFENDDAFFLVRDTGPLYVYNLGMLVCQYPAHTYGLSGTVVSKKQFALNIARNAIVDSQCEVWKRIRKVMRARSDLRLSTEKPARMTEDERRYLAARINAGEFPEWEQVRYFPLIRTATGKDVRLIEVFGYHRDDTTIREITLCPDGQGQLGERLMRMRDHLIVISHKTLERFGVRDLNVFIGIFHSQYAVTEPKIIPFAEAAAEAGLDSKNTILNDKELTPQLRAQLQAIRHVNSRLGGWLCGGARKIFVGESTTANGWTDGHYIAINKKYMTHLSYGLLGAAKIIYLLIHEYAHDAADFGEHDHDLAFYEKFHDWVRAHAPAAYHAPRLVEAYLESLKKANLPVPSSVLKSADELDRMKRASAQDEGPADIPARPSDIAACPKARPVTDNFTFDF